MVAVMLIMIHNLLIKLLKTTNLMIHKAYMIQNILQVGPMAVLQLTLEICMEQDKT
jgi:hypothetical protein